MDRMATVVLLAYVRELFSDSINATLLKTSDSSSSIVIAKNSEEAMPASKSKLIDDDTLELFRVKRIDDREICSRVASERDDTEFRYLHVERLNNWRTDEIYSEKAEESDAVFLETLMKEEHSNFLARQEEEAEEQVSLENDRTTFGHIMSEMKDLKLQCLQNKAAADLRKSQKKKSVCPGSRLVKNANGRASHVSYLKIVSLIELDAHERRLKTMTLARNIQIRDVEDPELRCIAAGLDFNAKYQAQDAAKMKVIMEEERRVLNAKIFSQVVRDTKEIEQLREIHLLKIKNMGKVCDFELESIDEIESMKASHILEENCLEAELKALADKEEESLRSAMVAHKARIAQRYAALDAARKMVDLKKNASSNKKKEQYETMRREREFWLGEEERVRDYLQRTGQPCTQALLEVKAMSLLDKGYFDFKKRSAIYDEQQESDAEDVNSSDERLAEDTSKAAQETSDGEKKFARETFRIEHMRKLHQKQLENLKAHNKKVRDELRKAKQTAHQSILKEHEHDESRLRRQQEKEMYALIETQKTSEKADEDNKVLNERLNGMLPRFVVDAMKRNETVKPRHFDNLILLTTDIVSFTALRCTWRKEAKSNYISSESSAKQIISLLNRLFSAMDQVLDSFHDTFKLETIGDAYCVVSGLNSADRSPRLNAIDMVECALSFIEIVENIDMLDQVKDEIQIRIGLHCGSAVGGVANLSQPKFSLFGDTVSTTALMEQTSRPNAIHISGSLYELVKDDYEFDVSESVTVQTASGGKKKIPTYWVLGRKTVGSRKVIQEPVSIAKQAGVRSIQFSQ
ncbi:Nitrogen permease regulator 2 [Dinochytrium kinnereticum]|nr:Nitrogen permease regulator 2 [Dinochytrium kinnereticum]